MRNGRLGSYAQPKAGLAPTGTSTGKVPRLTAAQCEDSKFIDPDMVSQLNVSSRSQKVANIALNQIGPPDFLPGEIGLAAAATPPHGRRFSTGIRNTAAVGLFR